MAEYCDQLIQHIHSHTHTHTPLFPEIFPSMLSLFLIPLNKLHLPIPFQASLPFSPLASQTLHYFFKAV